jgi:hypothetical protein
MPTPRIGAVMVVQNDAETVEKALTSFYDQVERIVVSTDPKRGWSGAPITPDETLERVRALDRARKIEILEDDFCKYDNAMKNETWQREVSAKRLNELSPGLDWIVQIDADEEFLDFGQVKGTLGMLPPWTRGVYWRWIQLFQILDDGRYLVITDPEGHPVLEPFPLAHRPHAPLQAARHVQQAISNSLLRRLLLLEFKVLGRGRYDRGVLHYSYAKSEKRIREKLATWGHIGDFDTGKFFELWQRSKTDWEGIRDFHPVYPIAWPALKPFTPDELRVLSSK